MQVVLYSINVLLGISHVYYKSLAGKYKWKKHRKNGFIFMQKSALVLYTFSLQVQVLPV